MPTRATFESVRGLFALFATFIGGGFDAQINPDSDAGQPASQVFPDPGTYAPGKGKGRGARKVHPDLSWTTPLIRLVGCTIPHCLASRVPSIVNSFNCSWLSFILGASIFHRQPAVTATEWKTIEDNGQLYWRWHGDDSVESWTIHIYGEEIMGEIWR